MEVFEQLYIVAVLFARCLGCCSRRTGGSNLWHRIVASHHDVGDTVACFRRCTSLICLDAALMPNL